MLTPAYYPAAKTDEAVRRHYEAVADASPIPVLLYNVPANTGFHLPVAVVSALAAHPNVAGVKDSAGDAVQLAELATLTRTHARFQVLSGNFGTLLEGLEAGAVGGILAVANVAPAACVEIVRLHRAARRDEAAALHARILPLARAVTSRWGVPGLKAAMEMTGVPCGVPRGPLLPLDDGARAELRRLIEAANVRMGADAR